MPAAELKTFWTPDRIEELKTSWAAGKSASTICFEMGAQSRSAIIGKVHRLGLVQPEGKPRARRRSPRPAYYRAAPEDRPTPMSGVNIIASIKRKRAAYALPPLHLATQPGPTLEYQRGINQLENCSCRWPLWDLDAEPRDKFYCGIPEADFNDGRSYCHWHSALGHYQHTMKEAAE